MKFTLLLLLPLLWMSDPAFADSELLLVEFVARHGVRGPNAPFPWTEAFWRDEVNTNAKQLSPRGVDQGRSFGSFLRERYIDTGFMESDWDEKVFHIYASSANDRPMSTAMAFLQTFYPGAAVPLYSSEPRWLRGVKGELFAQKNICPAFNIEEAQELQDFETFVMAEFSDLIDNITDISEFLSPTPTLTVLKSVWDAVTQMIAHEYPDIPQYLLDNYQLMVDLMTIYEKLRYVRLPDPSSPYFTSTNLPEKRQPAMQLMKDVLIQNMEGVISGDSRFRFHAYFGHQNTLIELYDVLGIDYLTEEQNDCLLFELRNDLDTGVKFIRSYFISTTQPWETTFQIAPIGLPCTQSGEIQEDCSLDDYKDFLVDNNLGEDCCYRGRGFDERCSDYLNEDTLLDAGCKAFRDFCPDSCGPKQVLDGSTLLCVRIEDDTDTTEDADDKDDNDIASQGFVRSIQFADVWRLTGWCILYNMLC